ncbi:RagB/SusD family nutrient uptake outer membrane protein [Dyadobacter psychrotolerans]|uniref:RagB/SusD family nutrient uptake outer membrane protein n=2 Tax=Dyadobacter psychrotolerans TaxID=2541721 RepID=A0A4R5DCP1_9BACT|nr:RagB/SusD family nutrient uptake outer membrane protein [Dyadobacter psychrotolerans]
MKLLRFADILLIYAEVANMQAGAPTQPAVDRLKMINDRANAGTGKEAKATLSMTKSVFDQKVIDKRSFETGGQKKYSEKFRVVLE